MKKTKSRTAQKKKKSSLEKKPGETNKNKGPAGSGVKDEGQSSCPREGGRQGRARSPEKRERKR